MSCTTQEKIELLEKRVEELEKLINKNGISIRTENGNSFDVIVNETMAGVWVSNQKKDRYLGMYSTSIEDAIGIGHYHGKPQCLDACLYVDNHVGGIQLNTKTATKQYDGDSLPGNILTDKPEITYS